MTAARTDARAGQTVVEAGRAEKLPPNDIEAEEAVVASLLVDSEAIYKIAPTLKPDDFFREKNAWAYEACLALWERNQSINQITVSHELARRGRLEEVGGAAYLSRLVTELPTSVGVEHYAGLVQRDSSYRKLITAAGHIAQMAYQAGPDVGDVLARAEAAMSSVREDAPLGIVSIGDLPEPGVCPYTVTGIFQRGTISGVFGTEGVGKSYFGVDLATAIATGQLFLGRRTEQTPVAIADFEGLGEEEFARRAYRIARGRGLNRPPSDLYFLPMTKGLLESIGILRAAVAQKKLGALVVDSLSFAGVVDEATAIAARRELANLGCTIIVLDHQARVQRLENYDAKGPYGSRFKEAMAASLWQLELAESQPAGAIEILMRCKKYRSGPRRTDIGVRISFSIDRVTVDEIDPTSSAALSTKLPAIEQVEDALKRLEPVTADQIAEATGLKKDTVKTMLSRLKRAARAHSLPGTTARSPHTWVTPSSTLLSSTQASTPAPTVDGGVDVLTSSTPSTPDGASTLSTLSTPASTPDDDRCATCGSENVDLFDGNGTPFCEKHAGAPGHRADRRITLSQVVS